MKKRRPLADRFWTKVEKTSVCWLWIGGKDHYGYGAIQAGGAHGGVLKAHRVAWTLAGRELLPSDDLLHSCDNPSCVNPGHLFIGTHTDNMADKVAKHRHNFGEHHGMNKLTDATVRFIRASDISVKCLMKRFGVSRKTIYNAKHAVSWRHLDVS